MATRVGGIEAVLRVLMGEFRQNMDEADTRMDTTEKKAVSMGDSVETIGLKLAAVGTAISALFGLAARAADQEAQVLGRVDAAIGIVGASADDTLAKVMPLVDGLELFGVATRTELLDTFGKVLTQTGNVDAALEALALSTKLSAQGMGDVNSIAQAVTEALSGNAQALASIDKGFTPVILKWQKLVPEIGEANARIGLSNELLTTLRERAEFAPSITPWQRFGIAMERIRLDVGRVVLEGLNPLLERAAGGIEILRRFADTGLGRVVIRGAVVLGVLTGVGGALLGLGAGAIKAFAGIQSLITGGSALIPILRGMWLGLVRIVAVAGALEAGLQIGNLLNQWDDFRMVVQRVFAGLSFGVESLKGLFGRGNKELAQSYWDIASGKIAVGEDAPETISLLDQVEKAMQRLAEAGNAVTDVTTDQIDLNALLQETLKGLADVEADLADKRETAADTGEKAVERESAVRQDEDIRRRRAVEDRLLLQRGEQEEVLRRLQERRDATITAIEVATAFEGEARTEQLEALAEQNEAIAALMDELSPELVDPWEQARESAISFGGFASEVVGTVSNTVDGLSNALADQFVGSANSARVSFGKFAGDFLRRIATMIARALFLSAILSVLPGGGTFAGNIGRFFGAGGDGGGAGGAGGLTGATFAFDDPVNDSVARREGGRLADLFLSGMTSRLDRNEVAGGDTSSSDRLGRGLTMEPIIEVNEATPQTWIRIHDRFLRDRIRETEEARTA